MIDKLTVLCKTYIKNKFKKIPLTETKKKEKSIRKENNIQQIKLLPDDMCVCDGFKTGSSKTS